ncbi:putative ATP/GTP-binding protein [Pedobacter sp. BAL39]|uniref:discoidin domain-containing protein n=1 Tax=Pedobacter sp. BAL39 TaxID=391596 RepID=UPI000155A5BA|nr:discoidin domain-containing protein [Pedobacter sp. BAL39]EDM33980.1 putative ATP/GTP-binding protein [Pedobacter sp. BAL39]
MKKLHFYIVAMFFAAVVSSCTKDGGAYDPTTIDKEFKGTTYEYLKSKPGIYDSLLKAIDRIGAQSILTDSSVTLFAVTNPGFQVALTNLNNLYALSDKPAKSISTLSMEQLDTMVTQYIIRGRFDADTLRQQQDGLFMTSAKSGYPMHASLQKATASGSTGGGPEYILISDTKRSQFNRDWVGTTTSSINIKTRNGLVHVVTSDHVFGFDDFIKRLTFNPPPPNLFKIYGGVHTVSRESGGGPSGVEGSNNVIDDNPETKFLVGWDPKNVTLTFELNVAAVAGAYTVTAANDAIDRDPADWNLQGSVNGSNWVTLDTKANQSFNDRFEQKVIRFTNREAYKFYRLNITRNNGSDAMQMADWSVNLAK